MSLLEVYIYYKRGIYSNVCDQNKSVNNSSKSLNYHLNISKICIWDNMGVEGPR